MPTGELEKIFLSTDGKIFESIDDAVEISLDNQIRGSQNSDLDWIEIKLIFWDTNNSRRLHGIPMKRRKK